MVEFADGWTGGALCARLLTDLGAETIKVEPPAGDSSRREPSGSASAYSSFDLIGAGKRSVVADPTSAADRARVQSLCHAADVIVDDLGPAGLGSFGLDQEELRRDNERLIYCGVSDFGSGGPLSGWVGSDLLVQAMSGVMSSTGFEGGPATRIGVPLGEHVSALVATAATFAALSYREREGVGQAIDISAQDCLIPIQSSFLPQLFVEGSPSPRQGYLHPLVAPWDMFRARDGEVIICVATDTQWGALLEIVGRGDLVGDERYATPPLRRKNVAQVTEIIAPWVAEQTVGYIIERLERDGIPAGPIVPIGELLEGEHFRARGLLVDVPRDDGGTVRTMGSIFDMSETPSRVASAAARLGADTQRMLGEQQPTEARTA